MRDFVVIQLLEFDCLARVIIRFYDIKQSSVEHINHSDDEVFVMRRAKFVIKLYSTPKKYSREE